MDSEQTFKFSSNPRMDGTPELIWKGKKTYCETKYCSANIEESYGQDNKGWMNKIYYGDNLDVMSHLLKEYRGKVNLIYIDPPFNSDADYKSKINLKGDKRLNAVEIKQFGDKWNNDEYLQFMYERLILMRELLSDSGSIYLHCDWHKSHYLRIILDETFGVEFFRNEISWMKLTSAKSQSALFSNIKDSILFYTKSNKYTFNPQYIKGIKDDQYYNMIEELTNRRYGSFDFTQSGQGEAKKFGKKLLTPPAGKHWIWSQEKIDEGMLNGRIIFTKNGTPRVKKYLDEKKGNYLGDLWNDDQVAPLSANDSERTNYPTQKPEALIERIIKASSNPGDLIFDCFMGSGTTQAVAMKLGRRFIGTDINAGAIYTTTKRLLKTSLVINSELGNDNKYTGFEVYTVNGCNRTENDAHANIAIEDNKLVIKDFRPDKLIKMLTDKGISVADWRQIVDSIMIDWNYDGKVFRPSLFDIPDKKDRVLGEYTLPKEYRQIKIKITDILSNIHEKELSLTI